VVDAVIEADTHRDVHAVEMASPTGSLIARIEIANNSGGFRSFAGVAGRACAWPEGGRRGGGESAGHVGEHRGVLPAAHKLVHRHGLRPRGQRVEGLAQ
jgi:hypothetical protein